MGWVVVCCLEGFVDRGGNNGCQGMLWGVGASLLQKKSKKLSKREKK